MSVAILTRHPSGSDAWMLWESPVRIIVAVQPSDVADAIAHVESEAARGHYAIGFLTYEAGNAFDPRFIVNSGASGLPLAWFAIFKQGRPYEWPQAFPSPCAWAPPSTEDDYRAAIEQIKQFIARGETYQVNYTFALHADRRVLMKSLFHRLYRSQPTPYAMYIETPAFRIASVSPELFFRLDENRIACQPMKGTMRRAPHPALDDTVGEALHASAKNRAENLMITDMVRNDLGRIAEPGSITVENLFKTTRWPTLWQMTTDIHATTTASLADIFAALFPSASITGAPKLQTSTIIARLEAEPRGLYTGAIGWVGPGRHAQFAVAIRTAVTTSTPDKTTYGIGSGIVWDSVAAEEYQECLLKSRILDEPVAPRYRLLETMRWQSPEGFLLRDAHIDRMALAAGFFGFHFDRARVCEALEQSSASWRGGDQRVRVLVDFRGEVSIESSALDEPFCASPDSAPLMSVSIDTERHDVTSPFWYHKTTQRDFYEAARKRFPDAADVLLVNRDGEVMEFTNGNIVLELDGKYVTPLLRAGLLPGVFRQQLLNQHIISEKPIALIDVERADAIYFINSVRGWRRAVC